MNRLAWVLVLSLCGSRVAAAAEAPEEQFARAATALEQGAFEDAIDQLEALADSGFAHPDASYDRAVAYVLRARSPQARPGDLGRAAAAYVEVLELRSGDREARAALETVREEIVQRRLRGGGEPAVVSPSLARAVVGLLDEGVWTVAAAVGSFLLALGLALRWLVARATVRLAGGVTAAVGAILLVVMGPLAATAVHYRLSSQLAVVVAPESRLLDEAGVPLAQRAGPDRHAAVPEGSEVFVLERRGKLARVEWGTTRAWVTAADLRVVATR